MKAAARRKLFLKNPVQPHIIVLENVHFEQADLDYLWSLAKGLPVARADFDAFWNAFQHADTLGSLIEPKPEIVRLLKPLASQLSEAGNLLAPAARKVVEQASYLLPSYSVAAANPPYMGSKNMTDLLASYLSERFPEAKSDLYAAFIERTHALVERGYAAMITMQSWTFQTTFLKFRKRLLSESPVVGMLGLGAGAFDSMSGEVVNACAFVCVRGHSHASVGAFYRFTSRGEAAMSAEFRAALDSKNISEFPSTEFDDFPNSVIAYWLTPRQAKCLSAGTPLSAVADAKVGLQTGDNDRFLRAWWEVPFSSTSVGSAHGESARWIAYSKGGAFRKWFGNLELVVDWAQDGRAIKTNRDTAGKLRARPQNLQFYGRPAIEWSDIGQPVLGARLRERGTMFDVVSMSLFSRTDDELELYAYLAYLNSVVADLFIKAIAPGMHANTGYVGALPWQTPTDLQYIAERASECVEIAQRNWGMRETAVEFNSSRLLSHGLRGRISDKVESVLAEEARDAVLLARAESENNAAFIQLFELNDELAPEVLPEAVTLDRASAASLLADLVSYAVGCMFGRYSLDEPGLILADQGSTLQEYLAKVPMPSFAPDKDNVIPFVDGPWFEDDIVEKFRQFLRAAFGEDHFQENLKFVTDSLGVKDLRDYFIKAGSKVATSRFYDDHVQRYKRRPIYWLFSSPSGAFNALVYLHRYSPSTVSTVLTGYLREYISKLEANLEHQELLAAGQGGATAKEIAAALQDADRIRKVLVELKDYDHDVLFPLAGKQIALDLDDGVLLNYQKLGSALKDIGLKKGGEDE